MKKILLFIGLTLSTTIMAQDITNKGLTNGRTIYMYIGNSVSLPPSIYGYSFEMGIWGKTKPTSIAIIGDFMKTLNSDINNTSIGLKGYLKISNRKNITYLYLSPKINLNNKKGLLELGYNPCFEINKHILLSVSIFDQIINVDNKFDKSIYNPGFGIGLLIHK